MEIDIEDLIYSALVARRKAQFKELYRDVKPYCTEATFNKHLKRLVERNIILRTLPRKGSSRPEYSVDPDIKTFEINFAKTMDNQISGLDGLFEMIHSDIKRLEYYSRNHVDDPKRIRPLFNRLVFNIVLIYKLVSALDFYQTSNLVPFMTKKKMKRQTRKQMSRLSKLLNEMKQVNPEFHFDLCVYIAEKML